MSFSREELLSEAKKRGLNVSGYSHDELLEEAKNRNIQLNEKQNKIEQIDKAMNPFGHPLMENPITRGVRNMGAGMFQAIKDITPDMSSMTPEYMNKILTKNKTPYELFGVEDKPFNTPEGALQIAGELALPFPHVKNAVVKGIEAISPGKYAKKAMENLGSGAKNIEESWSKLGENIRDLYKPKIETYKEGINSILGPHGEKQVFEKVDPLITTKLDNKFLLDNELDDLAIGDIQKAFKENPTFENAHKLQSVLGDASRELRNKYKPGMEGYANLQKINNARNLIKSSIGDFLEKEGKKEGTDLLGKYKELNDFYRDEISHFTSKKPLRELLRGNKETVKGLHKIFDTPSNILHEKTGEVIGKDAMSKLLDELPLEAKDQILFGKIGAMQHAKDPINLLKALESAQNKGYSKSFTPYSQDIMDELGKRITRQEGLKKIGRYSAFPVITGTAAGLSGGLLNLLRGK